MIKLLNIENLTTCLSVRDFSDWMNDFLKFLNDEYLKVSKLCPFTSVNDFYLDISNDQPEDVTYGYFDSKDILKEYEDIPGLKEFDDLNGDNVNDAAGIISNKLNRPFEEVLHELKGKLKKTRFKTIVTGSYNYPLSTITLYIPNIERLAGDFVENIKNCFIHELFHHLHYNLDDNFEIVYRHDYESDVVKESLATYIATLYVSLHGARSSTYFSNKMAELDKHCVSIYPYSGATYIKDFNSFSELLSLNISRALLKLLQFHKVQPPVTYVDVCNHNYNEKVFYKNSKLPSNALTDEDVVYLYLKGESVANIDIKYFHNDDHGVKSYNILKKHGVCTDKGSPDYKKGILLKHDIDTEISLSSGSYKDILLEIKKRY